MDNMWYINKKDAEGNKYQIRVIFRNNKLFIDEVGFIPKGKRKPLYLGSSLRDDYSYRQLDWNGKLKAKREKILEVVPEQLLLDTLTEVWKELQPTEVTFF